jgi:hypothetical protein
MRINIRDNATIILTPEGVEAYLAAWKELPPFDNGPHARSVTKPLIWVFSMITDPTWIESEVLVVASVGHAIAETLQVTTLPERPSFHVTVDLSGEDLDVRAVRYSQTEGFGLAAWFRLASLWDIFDTAPRIANVPSHVYIDGRMFFPDSPEPQPADHELLRAIAWDGASNLAIGGQHFDVPAAGIVFDTPCGPVSMERIPGLLRQLFEQLDAAPEPISESSIASILPTIRLSVGEIEAANDDPSAADLAALDAAIDKGVAKILYALSEAVDSGDPDDTFDFGDDVTLPGVRRGLVHASKLVRQRDDWQRAFEQATPRGGGMHVGEVKLNIDLREPDPDRVFNHLVPKLEAMAAARCEGLGAPAQTSASNRAALAAIAQAAVPGHFVTDAELVEINHGRRDQSIALDHIWHILRGSTSTGQPFPINTRAGLDHLIETVEMIVNAFAGATDALAKIRAIEIGKTGP